MSFNETLFKVLQEQQELNELNVGSKLLSGLKKAGVGIKNFAINHELIHDDESRAAVKGFKQKERELNKLEKQTRVKLSNEEWKQRKYGETEGAAQTRLKTAQMRYDSVVKNSPIQQKQTEVSPIHKALQAGFDAKQKSPVVAAMSAKKPGTAAPAAAAPAQAKKGPSDPSSFMHPAMRPGAAQSPSPSAPNPQAVAAAAASQAGGTSGAKTTAVTPPAAPQGPAKTPVVSQDLDGIVAGLRSSVQHTVQNVTGRNLTAQKPAEKVVAAPAVTEPTDQQKEPDTAEAPPPVEAPPADPAQQGNPVKEPEVKAPEVKEPKVKAPGAGNGNGRTSRPRQNPDKKPKPVVKGQA